MGSFITCKRHFTVKLCVLPQLLAVWSHTRTLIFSVPQNVNKTGRDSWLSKQVSILRETIAFQEKTHLKDVQQRKQRIRQLNMKAAVKEGENAVLNEKIQREQLTVSEMRFTSQEAGNKSLVFVLTHCCANYLFFKMSCFFMFSPRGKSGSQNWGPLSGNSAEEEAEGHCRSADEGTGFPYCRSWASQNEELPITRSAKVQLSTGLHSPKTHRFYWHLQSKYNLKE